MKKAPGSVNPKNAAIPPTHELVDKEPIIQKVTSIKSNKL